MPDLSAFPIASRWPAKHPDRLQLYSFPTPNGVKVSIALEELELPYEPHAVDIGRNESWTPEFLSLNPNGRSQRSSTPMVLTANLSACSNPARSCFIWPRRPESSSRPVLPRYETIQWVFFQMAGIGPIFGQVGFFHKFAGREIEDKRPSSATR